MSLIKGPFTLKWGDNTITDVEEIDISHEIDSEDYQTLQGQTIELDGPYKVTAMITLLKSDIPALAAVLPQHFVANGGTLSTGETVNEANGAIDVYAQCSEVYNNLTISSCANPANVLRLVNARSKIDGIDITNKVQKVTIKFVGTPDPGEATVQWYEAGSISVVS